MKLYEKILCKVLEEENQKFFLDKLQWDAKELVEMRCYQTLEKIQSILQDETLEDPECFLKIEKILCEVENIGGSGGLRHDF